MEVNEYPYLAAIFQKAYRNTLYFKCGGILLAPDIVLTAAHCAAIADVVMTPLHHLEIDRTINEKMEQPAGKFLVERVVTHPGYDAWSLNNDVCLLKLVRDPSWLPSRSYVASLFDDVSFYPGIQLNSDPQLPLPEAELHVVGWGTTETELHTNKPLDTTVHYLPNDECGKRYTPSITPSMMCGTSLLTSSNDACTGDSGGPLILKGMCLRLN